MGFIWEKEQKNSTNENEQPWLSVENDALFLYLKKTVNLFSEIKLN